MTATVTEPTPTVAPKKTGSIISVEGVTVSFDGFKALNNLTFFVDYGELRVVIGPNGAGKTTLLDVITGKVKPTVGRVIFEDYPKPLGELNEYQIANLGIGRKFQTPTVFPNLTVQENLMLAAKNKRGVLANLLFSMKAEQKKKIEETLETMRLADQANRPAGLLSHGQKQWLEISMLIMQDPKLMLLDEPAAGMTDEETERTGELLKQIATQHTVLVIDHDMEFVKQIAQKVTVMHEGALLCEGTVEKVQADPKVREVYLGREKESAG